MPQSIYQTRNRAHGGQAAWVPDDWAYIGQTVQSISPANGKPNFTKVPVWDIVGNLWIQLNADLDKVDYALSNLKHDQVMLTIHDHLNWDFLSYALTITSAGKPTRNITLADNTLNYLVTLLVPDTPYTFDLRANLKQGGQTGASQQTITTLANPEPMAPVLVASSPTNSSIVLTWTDPAGSTASKWDVYVGQKNVAGARLWKKDHTTRTITVTGLEQDKYYFYYVVGVNSTGLVGKPSNQMQWATGHNSVRNNSGIASQPLHPSEWGSWRPDIGWKLWYSRANWNYSIYNGYWQGPNNSGPTPRTITSEESGRYRGIVTYNGTEFRNRMNARYGAGVSSHLNITKVEIRRVYRMREPGNYDRQYMEWHLTHTNIFNAAAGPPIYDGHRNSVNNVDSVAAHDAMKAGTYILNLRLPRRFGQALINGSLGGTEINGLMLYRGDHQNNGYGTAGYGEWAGHMRHDRSLSGAERYSDWTLNIDATWNFEIVTYKGPFKW